MQNTGTPPKTSRAMLKKILFLTAASVIVSLLMTSFIMWMVGETHALPLGLSIATACPLAATPLAVYLFNRQTMELEATHKALEEAHRRLSEVHARLKDAHRDLEHKASHDSMTGLANRDKFLARLSELKREADSGYLLVIDADRFKQINDQHGHDTGDRALLAIGQAISGSIRATDLGARIGGEEFAVVLHGASREDAVVTAERIRACVERISLTTDDNILLKFTVSIGGAPFDPHSRTKEVMRAADHQLYEAKRNGRNQALVAGQAVRAA
ncbi:GGDEF domain-containing protein [uncultured Hoeflea sp.]|uniref:GGDEF domain-containing protein n=1 Tax=uncultured Hoeflea sp. TaxID=538666 RepID=UPI0030EC04F0